MSRSSIRPLLTLVGALLASIAASLLTPLPARAWEMSWMTPQSSTSAQLASGSGTLRMIVSPHTSGSELRVRLSNSYGSEPLKLGSASVAHQISGAQISRRSLRPLRFRGRPSTVIPPGGHVWSDPVKIRVRPFAELAVSAYLPDGAPTLSGHFIAVEDSYLTPPGAGDLTMRPNAAAFTKKTGSWFLLSAVKTRSARESCSAGSVVALGDSITDGAGSPTSADERYPDYLQRRLNERSINLVSLNAGVSGNWLTRDAIALAGRSALNRFEEDVLKTPRLRAVILLEGINDLSSERVSAAQIIEADKELIRRSEQAGVKLILGTLTPVGGSSYEAPTAPERQRVNRWIRSQRRAPIADFDRAVRDPRDTSRLQPRYSVDGIHLSAAGYKKMAQAVGLSELRAISGCRG